MQHAAKISGNAHANGAQPHDDTITSYELEKIGSRFLSLVTQYSLKDVMRLYKDLIDMRKKYKESIFDVLQSVLLEILKRDKEGLVLYNDNDLLREVYGENYVHIITEVNRMQNERVEKQFPVHILHINEKGAKQASFMFCDCLWYIKAVRIAGQFGLFLCNEDIENKGSLPRPITTQVCLGVVNAGQPHKGVAYRFNASWKDIKANGFYDKLSFEEISCAENGWLDDNGTLYVIVEIKHLPTVLTKLDENMTKSLLEMYQFLRKDLEKRYARERIQQVDNTELVKVQNEMKNLREMYDKESLNLRNSRDYCESLKRQMNEHAETLERTNHDLVNMTNHRDILSVQIKEMTQKHSSERSKLVQEKETAEHEKEMLRIELNDARVKLTEKDKELKRLHDNIQGKKSLMETDNRNLREQLEQSMQNAAQLENNIKKIGTLLEDFTSNAKKIIG